MTFEYEKMKIISKCCRSSFGGEVDRDLSLFEVRQRQWDEGKETRINNSRLFVMKLNNINSGIAKKRHGDPKRFFLNKEEARAHF